MHDAQRCSVELFEFVRVVQPGQYLRQNPQVQAKWHLLPGNSRQYLMQRLAVEEFHDEEVLAILRHGFVGLYDIRMIESHRDSRLVSKHLHKLFIVSRASTQLFYDEEFVGGERTGLMREIDIRHPTGTELLHNFVTTQSRRDEFFDRRGINAVHQIAYLSVTESQQPPEPRPLFLGMTAQPRTRA